MKQIELLAPAKPLATLVRELAETPVILTENKRPVAVLIPVGPNDDVESISLSLNPAFQAMLERSRRRGLREGMLTLAQVKTHLAQRDSKNPVKKQTTPKRRRAS